MKGSVYEVIKQSSFYNYNNKQIQMTVEKTKHFYTQAENLMSMGLRGKS
jgi:hypothetical protein